MKRKTINAMLFSLLAVMLILGCKNAFHEPEYNPSDPIVSDGKTYTVTFDRNSGSGTVPTPMSGESGESIKLPYQGGLSRTNYTFGGWNTNASGTGTTFAADAPFTVPNQNVTLYAKWDAVANNSGGGGATTTDPGQGGSGGSSSSWNVNDLDSWNTAIARIKSGGNNKTYTITVTGDFSVPSSNDTFGFVTGLDVTIEGNQTISLSTKGLLLIIRSDQKVTVKNLKLKGRSDNNNAVVDVFGGTFVMEGNASIWGNGCSGVVTQGIFIMNGGSIFNNSDDFGGGGVYVLARTFTMNGGTISNNTSKLIGGGVAVEDGTFTMNGGTISGNTAEYGGGVFIMPYYEGIFNGTAMGNVVNNIPDNVSYGVY